MFCIAGCCYYQKLFGVSPAAALCNLANLHLADQGSEQIEKDLLCFVYTAEASRVVWLMWSQCDQPACSEQHLEQWVLQSSSLHPSLLSPGLLHPNAMLLSSQYTLHLQFI